MNIKPKTHRGIVERCFDEIEDLRSKGYALNDIYSELSQREGWNIVLSTFRYHYYRIKKDRAGKDCQDSAEGLRMPLSGQSEETSASSSSQEERREISKARTQALFKRHRQDI